MAFKVFAPVVVSLMAIALTLPATTGMLGRAAKKYYRGQVAKPNCIFEKMQDVHGQPFVRIVTTRRVEPGEHFEARAAHSDALSFADGCAGLRAGLS